MEPFLCPHDDFLSMSIRELALDFGDFPSSANVVKTPKRLADFKVLTIAEIENKKVNQAWSEISATQGHSRMPG